MARHGQGRFYYVETAEDLLDPFMEEFDLLTNLEARALSVALTTLARRGGHPAQRLPEPRGGRLAAAGSAHPW